MTQLYGYETKRINETANRNKKRFPENFRFQLTKEEVDDLVRSQFATLNVNKGEAADGDFKKQRRGSNIKYFPYVYIEQGIAMLFVRCNASLQK